MYAYLEHTCLSSKDCFTLEQITHFAQDINYNSSSLLSGEKSSLPPYT